MPDRSIGDVIAAIEEVERTRSIIAELVQVTETLERRVNLIERRLGRDESHMGLER